MATSRPRPTHLKLVPPPEAPRRPQTAAFAYQNGRGETYYLHQGVTKAGTPRYFVAKTVGPGALATLPEGLEIAETANGVVSVRRVDTSVNAIPAKDVETVRGFLATQSRLRGHVVEVRRGEIVISEPVGGEVEDITTLARELGTGRMLPRLGVPSTRPTRYTPVMKLVRDGSEPGRYLVHRMTYRGDGGFRPLSGGSLHDLLGRFVAHLGTDRFFELY
jgi:hypothetical protein